MTKEPENNWKVIYTASRQEKKVALLLERNSIEHYLPLVKQLKIWSDRKKWVEVPLFNGYLFVRPVQLQRDVVLTIPGVVKYLRYNGKDGFVTEKEISIMKAIIAKGYDVSEFDGNEEFEPGEKVLVISGPMKNFEGEIITRKGENFAILVMNNFGHSLKIKLPKQVLKKIDG